MTKRQSPLTVGAARADTRNYKKFRRGFYSTRPVPSSPAVAVLTPKGATRPYRLETFPSGELALCKRVSASKHFLRHPPAIAFDASVLDWAEGQGARLCRIEDRETGAVYLASLLMIRQRGFLLERGFGRQIALPLGSWSIESPGQPRLFGGLR
jgi:hypothetical protein